MGSGMSIPFEGGGASHRASKIRVGFPRHTPVTCRTERGRDGSIVFPLFPWNVSGMAAIGVACWRFASIPKRCTASVGLGKKPGVHNIIQQPNSMRTSVNGSLPNPHNNQKSTSEGLTCKNELVVVVIFHETGFSEGNS